MVFFQSLIQFFAGAFLGTLLHQLALNDGLLHIPGEALVEILQTGPRLFITLDQRQQFLNLCHNALLLGQRREGKHTSGQIIFMNPLLSSCSSKRFLPVGNEVL